LFVLRNGTWPFATNAKEVEVELGTGFTIAESLASVTIAMQQQHVDRQAAAAVTRQLFEANAELFATGHY
jgi:methyl-accepting chemotaxis protein